ncbi:DNA repair protein RadC [Streptococcus urinalis FB127-CNA-2]|uniref:DNA repair protein RadC n=1 Tax=Streptococcus urinalis 2285-97 TaxID=764291 RepID=G5KFR1_9STRE|nr:DNA repair protein RadC [Streptococcus urinalis]EHJ55679.1 DNA repair protein RadC [Streptococcus urinalis 2285-97]EKS22123.1 DNA repair protein RadC [Streptococcus urinalis FB127-CNA-2]VEF31935.1 DNA repair protein RadC [Streptococcus urinalis]
MYQLKVNESNQQPRERLRQFGPETLSNQELLAILLRTGLKDKPVLALADHILKKIPSLGIFSQLSLAELEQLTGIGSVKAVEIKAMIEFSKRIFQSQYQFEDKIKSSQQLAKRLIYQIGFHKQEHLLAIYLDSQNRIIEEKVIFKGTVTKSIAEPREILFHACKNLATSLILAHNHPSNNVFPSDYDIQFTAKIKRSCEELGINCLDHIIVGKHHYYSFKEKNQII